MVMGLWTRCSLSQQTNYKLLGLLVVMVYSSGSKTMSLEVNFGQSVTGKDLMTTFKVVCDKKYQLRNKNLKRCIVLSKPFNETSR